MKLGVEEPLTLEHSVTTYILDSGTCAVSTQYLLPSVNQHCQALVFKTHLVLVFR